MRFERTLEKYCPCRANQVHIKKERLLDFEIVCVYLLDYGYTHNIYYYIKLPRLVAVAANERERTNLSLSITLLVHLIHS